MAFSRYYQITLQLLMAYTCDLYSIINNPDSAELTTVYMYLGIDGLLYCVEATNLYETGYKYPNITALKFSNESCTSYYYPGRNINELALTANNDDDYPYGGDIIYNGTTYGTVIVDANYNLLRHVNVIHDKIRIYISTGYVFNSIAGITLRVKAKVSDVKNVNNNISRKINDYLILLDWYMPKEILKDIVHWVDTPFYMNNKFYDRYIEIQFPSPYDCGIHMRLDSESLIDYVYSVLNSDNGEYDYYRGQINPDAAIIVEFATINPDYLTFDDEDGDDTTAITYASSFTTDSIRLISINLDSNSLYFNIKLYELDNKVYYYPVYGEGVNTQDFNIDIMYAIDCGNIPMINNFEGGDANSGMDDFMENYTDDNDYNVCKWVIINELSVTYNYDYIFKPDRTNTAKPYTEYFSNTIDYTNKSEEHGDFWKSCFIPLPKTRTNMEPTSIIILYICHLYNRMNCLDIVRTATMRITDVTKYLDGYKLIDISNINQFKIINKINKIATNNMNPTSTTIEKYIRTYYDVTSLVVKDVETGTLYSTGLMTLKLKHTNSNYLIKLYTTNADNVRIPYDLTGSTKYKLVFPSTSGDKIKLYPNMDSESNNLGIGSLMFYISEENVKKIMNVPTSERYFALMTDADDNSQESTLYEGKVDYYS